MGCIRKVITLNTMAWLSDTSTIQQHLHPERKAMWYVFAKTMAVMQESPQKPHSVFPTVDETSVNI
jgi:hypothetical protein